MGIFPFAFNKYPRKQSLFSASQDGDAVKERRSVNPFPMVSGIIKWIFLTFY